MYILKVSVQAENSTQGEDRPVYFELPGYWDDVRAIEAAREKLKELNRGRIPGRDRYYHGSQLLKIIANCNQLSL